MYRKIQKTVNSCENFELEGKLSENNRWVIMALSRDTDTVGEF
ncbi:MAG: hypothetical protein ACRC1Z_16565 [Waterburya sp.]